MTKLKLYVWREFEPDFSGGLAVAIASNEERARKQVEKINGYRIRNWGDLTVYPLTKPMAACVSGGS